MDGMMQEPELNIPAARVDDAATEAFLMQGYKG